jgi:hypothetical protein
LNPANQFTMTLSEKRPTSVDSALMRKRPSGETSHGLNPAVGGMSNFGPSLYANISYTRANEPGRLALSDAMMRSIGALARTGDPNNAALGVTWPTWPSMLLFDAAPTAKAISVQGSALTRMRVAPRTRPA